MNATHRPACLSLILLVALFHLTATTGRAAPAPLRAGAAAVDVSPPEHPVVLNCYFTPRQSETTMLPLHARALALSDGSETLVITVVDSCMLPRELIDRAKQKAREKTGIPTNRMLVSATHTHSGPAAMGCLGTDPDPDYPDFLVPRIAEAIAQAHQNLEPARLGWTVTQAPEHTHCRRWIRRPDAIGTDPFGDRTVRAHMHPGHQSSSAQGPAGPDDPGLSLLSVQSADGRPIALLANFSMHYVGSGARRVSADYFGYFARHMRERLDAEKGDPPFVGIMSQGTSGDLQWMDYSEPRKSTSPNRYAAELADIAHRAYQEIEYQDSVPLAMAERKLTLDRRTPDEQRLAWARRVLSAMEGDKPTSRPEIYAREQVMLHENPRRELKLQAIRIGALGITAIPNEVYALTGLKLKARSPLPTTFNIELANGAEGYIPPPHQFTLGGYTTWEARTAGLEKRAERKIVDTLLTLLEDISGEPRREPSHPDGPYAQAVLDDEPFAYYRFSEMTTADGVRDRTGRSDAYYWSRIALYLPGPPSPAFSGPDTTNRAPHFAGGRVCKPLENLGDTYSVELWFYNAIPNDLRPITGYLFSRGPAHVDAVPGDHLGLGGTASDTEPGRLLFYNGDKSGTVLSGNTNIEPRTWHHVVMVRDGERARIYLNGSAEPEIAGTAPITRDPDSDAMFIGGRNDSFANFQGKIDEVAIYDRVMTAEEAARHYEAAAQPSDNE